MIKERFVEIMTKLMEKREINEKWLDKIELHFDEGLVIDIVDRSYFEDAVKIVAAALNDSEGILEDFVLWKDGKFPLAIDRGEWSCEINNWGDLYDVIKILNSGDENF